VATKAPCADLYEFDPEQTRRPPFRVRVRTTLPFLGGRFESVRTITISDAVPGVSCRHTLTGYVRVRGPGGVSGQHMLTGYVRVRGPGGRGGARACGADGVCTSAGRGQRGSCVGCRRAANGGGGCLSHAWRPAPFALAGAGARTRFELGKMHSVVWDASACAARRMSPSSACAGMPVSAFSEDGD